MIFLPKIDLFFLQPNRTNLPAQPAAFNDGSFRQLFQDLGSAQGLIDLLILNDGASRTRLLTERASLGARLPLEDGINGKFDIRYDRDEVYTIAELRSDQHRVFA